MSNNILCVLMNLNIIKIFLIGGRVGWRWKGRWMAGYRQWANAEEYFKHLILLYPYSYDVQLPFSRPRGAPPGRITILFKSPRLYFEMRCRIIFACENPLSLSHIRYVPVCIVIIILIIQRTGRSGIIIICNMYDTRYLQSKNANALCVVAVDGFVNVIFHKLCLLLLIWIQTMQLLFLNSHF